MYAAFHLVLRNLQRNRLEIVLVVVDGGLGEYGEQVAALHYVEEDVDFIQLHADVEVLLVDVEVPV